MREASCAGGRAAPTFGIVGALAAFPRRLAARAVADAGGRLLRGMTRQTTHVVFGRGLLDRLDDAEIEARVRAERAAGRVLMSENALLRWLGLRQRPEAASLGRDALLGQGLPAPALELLALFDAFEAEAAPFTFRDVVLARKYAGLIAAGAAWSAVARAAHRSGPGAPLATAPLQVAGGGTICARLGDTLIELDGQLLLGLAPPEEAGEADADALFEAAEAAEAAGEPQAAARLYRRVLEADPGDAVAAFNWANVLRRLGRPAEAEAAYLRALRADPHLVEGWFNLGCLLRDTGRPDAARRALSRALAADPDYADAAFNLAALELERGDHAAARRWWQRYLELDDSSEWAQIARRGLGYIALKLGARAG